MLPCKLHNAAVKSSAVIIGSRIRLDCQLLLKAKEPLNIYLAFLASVAGSLLVPIHMLVRLHRGIGAVDFGKMATF